jgi:hypothetical protein
MKTNCSQNEPGVNPLQDMMIFNGWASIRINKYSRLWQQFYGVSPEYYGYVKHI